MRKTAEDYRVLIMSLPALPLDESWQQLVSVTRCKLMSERRTGGTNELTFLKRDHFSFVTGGVL